MFRRWVISSLVLVLMACAPVRSNTEAEHAKPIASQPPNILIIVADDLGYSDIGAYGGEIATPNLDALARRGMRLTGFYTSPACSPTRAMLLSGRDNHEVGLGSMAEVLAPEQKGKPGYEGYLTRESATLAEMLRSAGYTTMMSGKWHLGTRSGFIPSDRGFDQSFALLQGAHNHFGADQSSIYSEAGAAPTYLLGGKAVEWPVGAYSSDYFTDQFLSLFEKRDAGKPFFGYLAFTAPHWPLQARSDDIAKYKGRYDAGPAALAMERLDRMKKIGLVSADVEARPIVDRWTELSADERAVEARKMEVYAAMVDRLDWNIGRIVRNMDEAGVLANTVILFISDNGPEGLIFDRPVNPSAPTVPLATNVDNSLANMGAANSYFSYGPAWGQAGAAPYWGTKEHTSEGGIHSPGIISGPGVREGATTGALLHVTDIAPTVLSIAGKRNEIGALELEGHDWSLLLADRAEAVRTDTDPMAWELFYRRAIRQGNMKAVYQPSLLPIFGKRSKPGETRWQLYDLSRDPGETNDLSRKYPGLLKKLVKRWHEYAEERNVVLPQGEEMLTKRPSP